MQKLHSETDRDLTARIDAAVSATMCVRRETNSLPDERLRQFLLALIKHLFLLVVATIGLPHVGRLHAIASAASHERPEELYKLPAETSLGDFARATFGPLRPAEDTLLKAYQEQKAVICPPGELDAAACKTEPLGPDPVSFEKRHPLKRLGNVQTPGSSGTIRGPLIRWLLTNVGLINSYAPAGIVVVGARIEGSLNIESEKISFPLALINCVITQPIVLSASELAELNLDGTHTAGVFANYIRVHGAVLMRQFASSRPVRLTGAQIDGYLDLSHQTHITELVAYAIKVHGGILMTNGFDAGRQIIMESAEIDGNLDLTGGQFHNGTDAGEATPDPEAALLANYIKVHSAIVIKHSVIQGYLSLRDSTIDGDLVVEHSKFQDTGAHGGSGLHAQGATIARFFSWKEIILDRNTALDVSAARTASFNDDPESWPGAGRLRWGNFTYGGFEAGPDVINKRREWLDKYENERKAFEPQPYQQQLATVLRQNGDDREARRVLIESENQRYKHLGYLRQLWGLVLWATIDYGYDTWVVLWWIGGFVAAGTIIFYSGHRSGAIVPIESKSELTKPFNPFVFSLEAFLPLVDLNQARYWAPAPDIYRHKFGSALGRYVRAYLWFHNVAGWFFTSMLIAGVTGLARG